MKNVCNMDHLIYAFIAGVYCCYTWWVYTHSYNRHVGLVNFLVTLIPQGDEQAPNVHVGLVNFLVTLIPQGDEQAPNVHVGLVIFLVTLIPQGDEQAPSKIDD